MPGSSPSPVYFLMPYGTGGCRGPEEGRPERLTVLAAVHPEAAHRHQVAVATGLDGQDTEAVLGVVEITPSIAPASTSLGWGEAGT